MQASDFAKTVPFSAYTEFVFNDYFRFCCSYPTVQACYYDARGLTVEVSKKNYLKTCHHVNKHLRLYSILSKYVIADYAPGRKKNTAYSSVHRVSNGNKVAMLAGVFKGRFMCETGITVGHLFDDLDAELEEYEELEVGGGIVGRCCGKESEIVIDGKMYTADIAAISFPPSPNNPICYDHFSEIDINGQVYQSRLWMGDENSILPNTTVWMVNQDGKLKIGKICRLLLYDKELKLDNVMQIESENSGESFSKKGDSGCRIFLPPTGADHMVHVIGIVISKVKYETIRLTNGVWLGKVLPHFLRTLAPPRFKGPHPLTRDDNLPYGLDFVEGLEFSGSIGKFENLSVKSLQPLYPENDTGVVIKARLKEFGPRGGLFESRNCTPVECSEDSLIADDDSDVLGNVDSGIDTLASVLGDLRC